MQTQQQRHTYNIQNILNNGTTVPKINKQQQQKKKTYSTNALKTCSLKRDSRNVQPKTNQTTNQLSQSTWANLLKNAEETTRDKIK